MNFVTTFVVAIVGLFITIVFSIHRLLRERIRYRFFFFLFKFTTPQLLKLFFKIFPCTAISVVRRKIVNLQRIIALLINQHRN